MNVEKFKKESKEVFDNEVKPQIANAKMTAVEWLVKQYLTLGTLSESIVEQAKAMEKEQIKEVFIDVSDVLLKETDTQQKAKIKQAAEQYYNETFKSE